jgi:protoheme IX farnesyltransferase
VSEAIAWMYREDYERVGYLVLPSGDRRNSFMAWQSVLPSLGLILLSLAPMLLGNEGLIYTAGALLFSACFLYYGGQLAIRRTNAVARRLASILYLPLVFVLMAMDKT